MAIIPIRPQDRSGIYDLYQKRALVKYYPHMMNVITDARSVHTNYVEVAEKIYAVIKKATGDESFPIDSTDCLGIFASMIYAAEAGFDEQDVEEMHHNCIGGHAYGAFAMAWASIKMEEAAQSAMEI